MACVEEDFSFSERSVGIAESKSSNVGELQQLSFKTGWEMANLASLSTEELGFQASYWTGDLEARSHSIKVYRLLIDVS